LASSRSPNCDNASIPPDSGDPLGPTQEIGGTGRRNDREISGRIREELEVPVFLAGGLNPANVAQAVAHVGPYRLDVCSGLRVDGSRDAQLLNDFFGAAGLISFNLSEPGP
jgi:phosphoribosylanthranilate isomerase